MKRNDVKNYKENMDKNHTFMLLYVKNSIVVNKLYTFCNLDFYKLCNFYTFVEKTKNSFPTGRRKRQFPTK